MRCAEQESGSGKSDRERDGPRFSQAGQRNDAAMTMKAGFIPFCGYTVTPLDARSPERTARAVHSPSRLDIWAARRRQRKALGELADCSDHLLKDIGISRDDALREAGKWFWQK
jgi:uncharacterized protein YjiS (DUF1127 family)